MVVVVIHTARIIVKKRRKRRNVMLLGPQATFVKHNSIRTHNGIIIKVTIKEANL